MIIDPFAFMRTHIEKLSPMTDSDFTRLRAHFQSRTLKRGEHLYRQGVPCETVGFILSGCVRSYHVREDGSEHILYFAREEWWVADLQSFWEGSDSRFNLQALERCRMLVSSKPQFEGLVATNASYGAFYRAKVGRAYSAASMKVVVERTETAEERYRQLVAANEWIVDRVPLHHLASFLGIRPQSLSRIRAKCKEESTEKLT